MNILTTRRRIVGKEGEINITITILTGYTGTNGKVSVSGNWKTAKIVFDKPVYVNEIKSSSGSLSYAAAVIAKNENGSIVASGVMRPLPVVVSVDRLIKEIHSSFQNSGYCEIDGKRIWDSSSQS